MVESSSERGGLWDDAPVISSYTRSQAIADGVLVDVTEMAAEAGFKLAVALTRDAWSTAVEWDDTHGGFQDETGRLWDVVWMAGLAARRHRGGDRVAFDVLRVPNRPGAIAAQSVELVVCVGPGDHGEPVVTIMLPSDD
jgi:hypothetical protein